MENEFVFEAGEIIIRPGIISPGTYIITSGRVRRESAGLFSFLQSGDFFGEEGAVVNAPATYSVVAVEDTTAYLLDSGAFFDALTEDRVLLQRVVGKLVATGWDTIHEDKNEQMMFVFSLLEQLFDQSGEAEEVPLADVVSKVGLSEEMVVSVIEQIAFEEGAFLSVRDDMVLFSKEKISHFLSRRRIELFIMACMQRNIGDQRGVGEFTLLQTALQSR